MTTSLFTTRTTPSTIALIDKVAKEKNQSRRVIFEDAISLFIREQKKKNIRTSFQSIGSDGDMMTLAESGLEDIKSTKYV